MEVPPCVLLYIGQEPLHTESIMFNLFYAVRHMVQTQKMTQPIIRADNCHKTKDSISSQVKYDTCTPQAEVDVALRLL